MTIARETQHAVEVAPAAEHAAPAPPQAEGEPAFAAMASFAMARDLRPLAERVTTPAVELPYRADLERAFGQSLGSVRVHVGERAALQGLGGRAAADGDVVAFADPSPGREVVAHEITHVVQARRGGGGGAAAEAEARGTASRVDRGEPAGAVIEGASGIHLDGGDAPPVVNARDFLRELRDIRTIVLHMISFTGAISTHPLKAFFDSEKLLQALVGYGEPTSPLWEPFTERLESYLVPDSLVAIVNKARAAQKPAYDPQGPAHYVYMDSVGAALGNVLVQRVRESISRLLPRYVAATGPTKNKDGTFTSGFVVTPSEVQASHPFDRLLAVALCASSVPVDVPKYAAAHPEVVKATKPVRTKPLTIKFPWDRGLWHWVEASEQDATAEEVAGLLFGNEDQAYRLTPMAPLFGFRATDVADFLPAKRRELNEHADKQPQPVVTNAFQIAAYDVRKDRFENNDFDDEVDEGPARPAPQDPGARPAPIYAFSDRDVDPAAELAAVNGNKYALERAKAKGDGKHHDEKQVYEQLKSCVDLLDNLAVSFPQLGLAADRVTSTRMGFVQRREEAAQACLVDPDAMYALAKQQASVLGKIAKGLAQTSAQALVFGGIAKEGDDLAKKPDELPDTVKQPIADVVNAYSGAFDALALPELADPRVDHADALQRVLRITILENSLDQVRPTIQVGIDHPEDRHEGGVSYDLHDKASENDAIRAKLAQLRIEMESDPARAEKELGQVEPIAGDYLFEMSIIANLEALDHTWGAINGEHGFWESGMDDMIGQGLEKEDRGYYKSFQKDVWDKFKNAKTDDDKKAARDAFKNIVKTDDFQSFFKRAQDHIEDDEKHKRWTKIAAGIVIAVAAMGLGQIEFAAILAETESVGLAAVAGGAVETATGAVLNKLVLDVDPTAGSLITGFLAAGAMYSLLGRSITLGRAAGVGAEMAEATERLSLMAKAGNFAVDFTKETITMLALNIVTTKVQKFIDHEPTDIEVQDMFVHTVAGLIGMKIGQHVVNVTLDPMAPLRGFGAQHGLDIHALMVERQKLIEDAKVLEGMENADPGMAHDLVAREKAWLERVHAAREKLLELAKKHPEQVSGAKVKELEGSPDVVDDPALNEGVAQMSLEQIGPGLYQADARGFDALLATHKQSHDRLVAIDTDPVSGVRTLRMRTADGTDIRIKEKLPDVGDRKPPAISIDEARRFEHWLDHETPFYDPAMRDRMRELYARDPKAAIDLAAQRNEFSPSGGAGAALTSREAYDAYKFDKRGDEKKVNTADDKPVMDQTDFDAMYKAGYEYDPVSKAWTPNKTMKTGTVGGSLPGGKGMSEVVGEVHSEAVGEAVLQKLVAGEVEALRMLGIEPPKGFDSRTTEWGLGFRKSDGKIVVVRGDTGEVNWSHLPGIEPLAHSHPLFDPITGKIRMIEGRTGQGSIDAKSALSLMATATHQDLVFFLPSTGDLRVIALGGQRHVLMTPFVHLGEGRIGNPTPGMTADTVDIRIDSAEAVGTIGALVVYKGNVRVMVGETVIGSYEVYQTYHDKVGDMPSFTEPHGVTPLPPDHPMAKLESMPTGTTKLGFVEPETVRQMAALNVDVGGEVGAALGRLDVHQAGVLSGLVEQAMLGKVQGLNEWVARMKGLDAKGLRNKAIEMESALRGLGSDPDLRVRVGPDGIARYETPRKPEPTASAKAPKELAADAFREVENDPKNFERFWSDDDALRVAEHGRSKGLSDTQIRDLIRIAQRKNQFNEAGELEAVKQIKPDDMIQQMDYYVDVVLPRGYPERTTGVDSFKKLGDTVRAAVEKAGLPSDDIRVQGSALRKPTAGDIDLAVFVDQNTFNAELIKTFGTKVRRQGGENVPLTFDNLDAMAHEIAANEKAFTNPARTFAHAYLNKSMRASDFDALKAVRDALRSEFGKVGITVMAPGGYLDRAPYMQVPK